MFLSGKLKSFSFDPSTIYRMKITFILLYILTCFTCCAQDLAKPEQGYTDLLHDKQFARGIVGFTLAKTAGGKILFNKNGETGLARPVARSCRQALMP